MRHIILSLAACVAVASHAQPFLIGSRSITFYDDARNRDIATNLYYPGASAGNNAAVAVGEFPVLVIGHGFVMSVDAYANLWNHFVPKGYIVAMPTTEGGFAPDHAEFGADIAFVAQALQAANADAVSPFFTHVAPTTALMGHSMGGGASLLGAAGNSTITAVVDLAPAETNPSAVAACASITVPTLIFAGSNDCITPIADHTAPMYAALTVDCRAFVNIIGGGHCYFAENNFNCAFGEFTCSPSPDITRAQQHDVVNDFAGLWLDHFLKGDQQAFADLLDSLDLSTRAASEHTCSLSTAIEDAVVEGWVVAPNPANSSLQVIGVEPGSVLRLLDLRGREVLRTTVLTTDRATVDVGKLMPGAYRLILRVGNVDASRLVVIAR